MSVEKDGKISRRTVLKAASMNATAVSVGGIANSTGTAKEEAVQTESNDVSGHLVRQALRAEPVKAMEQ